MTNQQSSAPSQPSAVAKYPQFDSSSKEWHSTAISEAEQHIDHFIQVLISDSETICSHKEDEIVTRSHVRDAQKRIKKYQKIKRLILKHSRLLSSIMIPLISITSGAIVTLVASQPNIGNGSEAFASTLGTIVTFSVLAVFLILYSTALEEQL